MAHFRYLCIAGTGGRFHDWAHHDLSQFQQWIQRRGGEPIRNVDGSLYSWDGRLQGTFWTGEAEWHRQAEVVGRLLNTVPVEERRVFAHSHGGQIAIILARNGFRLRSLTTIATPYRPNLGAATAVRSIGYWQHIFDPEQDWISTVPRRVAGKIGLGGIGGGGGLERRFLVPGVINIGIPGVRHSRVFEEDFDKMVRNGVFDRAIELGADNG